VAVTTMGAVVSVRGAGTGVGGADVGCCASGALGERTSSAQAMLVTAKTRHVMTAIMRAIATLLFHERIDRNAPGQIS
jgi:hypothetical protein